MCFERTFFRANTDIVSFYNIIWSLSYMPHIINIKCNVNLWIAWRSTFCTRLKLNNLVLDNFRRAHTHTVSKAPQFHGQNGHTFFFFLRTCFGQCQNSKVQRTPALMATWHAEKPLVLPYAPATDAQRKGEKWWVVRQALRATQSFDAVLSWYCIYFHT